MITTLTALALVASVPPPLDQICPIELMVLGTSQDGGSPQLSNRHDPAWSNAALRRYATSLAIINRETGERVLFEATPDLREQLYRLDNFEPREDRPGLEGIFLTHAHMGHYTGLMFLGHESIGADGVPVYAMERMGDYLRSNGPWDQLVRYGNIELRGLVDGQPVYIAGATVTPFLVPHRQEYSEVVGFRIDGGEKSAIFIPDIDSWEEWDEMGTRIEDMIASVDYAFLDATFFANGEIPGRDMSGFPHPFITHSMERFADLPDEEKAKIRFIHLNHTNPVRYPDSPEREQVLDAGFGVALFHEVYCLSR
ncbi:MBL fold metallo-hydrolase [Maricaulis sp.]|uniref:MBL fold metallo-hydrolase n=1 Tax=Maricaulis sp. TaxID=1486257 RepID=UPI002638479B|nr:MBL fold metallo-hydrolase [Maricaulis sp.]